jgi:hypothetical protein
LLLLFVPFVIFVVKLLLPWISAKKSAGRGKEEKPGQPEGSAGGNPSRSLTRLYGSGAIKVEVDS